MSVNYNYSYVVRQPTMRRSSVRKKPFESNQQVTIIPDNNDFLCHFGILGQKWGVRRYQNEDGTYTEEGKKRYGRDSDSDSESDSWKKSDADKLSDEELRRRNNRLQMERTYRDLTTKQSERDKAQAEQFKTQLRNEIKKDFLKKALILPVAGILAYAGTQLIKNNGTKIVDIIGKYGKQALADIKKSNMLNKRIKLGSKKYLRKVSEDVRRYMPRTNAGGVNPIDTGMLAFKKRVFRN